jgi:hypothetical protein
MTLSESKRGSTIQLYAPHCDEVMLNSILTTSFNQPGSDGKYGTYIINRASGTGTDFLSHPAIEERGGVRVIICLKPHSFGELR